MHVGRRTAVVAERVTGAPRGPAPPWTAVGVLGLGAFAAGTATFVVAGVLGGLAADLGVSAGAAGLAVTVFAVGSAVGAPVLGALLAGCRQRAVLVGSLVVFGVANVLTAAAPSLPALLGARVLSALAAAAFVPAAGAAAVAAVPATHRGRALAVVLGGASAAMALGAPLGVLLAAALSWRAAFALVTVLTAVAVGGLLVVPAGGGRAAASGLRDRLQPLRSRTVTGVLGVTLLVMAGSNSAYTYVGPLLGPTVGPAGLALLIAAFGAGGAVGTWCGGTATDRWGSGRTASAAAGLLTAVFVLGPAVATGPVGAVALVLVWGAAGYGFVPPQQHRLVGLDAGPAPLVLALHSSAINLGFAAGSLLGGHVVDAGAARGLWSVAALCCGAGLVLHAARGSAS